MNSFLEIFKWPNISTRTQMLYQREKKTSTGTRNVRAENCNHLNHAINWECFWWRKNVSIFIELHSPNPHSYLWSKSITSSSCIWELIGTISTTLDGRRQMPSRISIYIGMHLHLFHSLSTWNNPYRDSICFALRILLTTGHLRLHLLSPPTLMHPWI